MFLRCMMVLISGILILEGDARGERVTAYVDGVSRVMEMDRARSLGLTIVDLSDDWVPYIFWSRSPGKDDHKKNDHLDTYVDLANDRIDVDGVALKRWQRNYLEVYGIPPSLSVLRRRFLEDEKKACFDEVDRAFLLDEYHGPVKVTDEKTSDRLIRRWQGYRMEYRRALKAARVRTLEALEKKRRYRRLAGRYRKYRWRYRAIRVMQKRLVCEGMFGKRVPRIRRGVVNWAVRQALQRFERKHDIYGWGMVWQDTARALGRSALQNNHRALERVLTARVVSAARILEDETNPAGRNLVQRFSRVFIEQLGLTTADRAMAFMKAHSEKAFSRMLVAVRLPATPAYYSDHMDLSVVIDRGDVWYDVPFDARGKRISRERKRFPHLTLYVNHGGKKIPLVKWRTTIGSWQPEIRHDEEYYKYKISDVGPRIWKHIVAGPVWVPPKNTPSRDMARVRIVRGHRQPIVAHQSFGPGYASAYGLVAAYHVTPHGRDNQVRTHGTANYMSIKSSAGYSHGCHRLLNHRAVRLFSFILGHRTFERLGQTVFRIKRRFEHRGEEFQLDLRTRGYRYELKPPVPVRVLEGRVRGKTKAPIKRYVKKPSVVYQTDLKSKKGKATSAPRVKKKPGEPMRQPQTM